VHPPEQIKPKKPADYLEVLTKAVFQSGMSWRVVEAKWAGFREAFHDFDPEKVASLTPLDVEWLSEDPRIIRNRRKIDATVDNAGALLEIIARHGSFEKYLAAQGGFAAKSAALHRDFRYIGEFGAYFFLYSIGQPVPAHEEWEAEHRREATG
jgi:DNA-3-methyladenine glycosylase I